MRTLILIFTFATFSTTAFAQRCADGNGMPIECPKIIKALPEIDPIGPDCTSCPNIKNLDFLIREDVFKNFIRLPFAMFSTALKVIKAD